MNGLADFIADITQIWTPATVPVSIMAGAVLGLVLYRLHIRPARQVTFWLLTVGAFWFGPVIVTRSLTPGQGDAALIAMGSALTYCFFTLAASATVRIATKTRGHE